MDLPCLLNIYLSFYVEYEILIISRIRWMAPFLCLLAQTWSR